MYEANLMHDAVRSHVYREIGQAFRDFESEHSSAGTHCKAIYSWIKPTPPIPDSSFVSNVHVGGLVTQPLDILELKRFEWTAWWKNQIIICFR